MKKQTLEQEETTKTLKAVLKDSNGVVYTILRSVSRSGMTRHISCYVWSKSEKRPIWLDGYIAKLGLYSRGHDFKDYLIVRGCGMDMGFEVVYSLSAHLFGYEHKNAYKLKQEWL